MKEAITETRKVKIEIVNYSHPISLYLLVKG